MNFDPIVLAIVLLAAVLHALWNALLKGSGDRLLSLGTIIGSGGILCLILMPFLPVPHQDSWVPLTWSVFFHCGYFAFLVAAYDAGDLSHVYPIARGSGPLLVALCSGWILGDVLVLSDWVGIVAISTGIALLALRIGTGRTNHRALVFALATGVSIAGYTLSDGAGVRGSGHAIAYVIWMTGIESLPLLLFIALFRRDRIAPFLRKDGLRAALGGLVAATAYGAVVWCYARGTVAPIAALRETSVILAALIGTRVLGEPFGRSRVVAATVVAAGILVLSLG